MVACCLFSSGFFSCTAMHSQSGGIPAYSYRSNDCWPLLCCLFFVLYAILVFSFVCGWLPSNTGRFAFATMSNNDEYAMVSSSKHAKK